MGTAAAARQLFYLLSDTMSREMIYCVISTLKKQCRSRNIEVMFMIVSFLLEDIVVTNGFKWCKSPPRLLRLRCSRLVNFSFLLLTPSRVFRVLISALDLHRWKEQVSIFWRRFLHSPGFIVSWKHFRLLNYSIK